MQNQLASGSYVSRGYAMRLDQALQLDASFGTNGIHITNTSGGPDRLEIGPDGTIALGFRWGLYGLKNDGTPDNSFGATHLIQSLDSLLCSKPNWREL
ncbi:MAG: hypothetical protein KDA87_15345 [Planctomycetales bacterium]|nr:hypothetical protein [Planctomycetales bacterium]